jgi:hypothetical protein
VDDSTRPSQKHRQWSAFTRCALAVLLFVGPSVQASSRPEMNVEKGEETQSFSQGTAHEVSISVVEPGAESISLAARLTLVSANVARDVEWQVRNEDGELILNATANEITSPLKPGQYVVEAQYGAVAVRESIQLIEGNSIAVNFVLNAGGLRVLSTLKGFPAEVMPTKTLVFSLSGLEKGKLIANSVQPGELLKLPAGLFRVENRVSNGNVSSVTDVRISPGKMSAIEVTHQAGIARLNYVGAPDEKVIWDITPVNGVKLSTLEGLSHQLALKPGTYIAEAHAKGEILTAKFVVVASEKRDIILGN